MLYQSTVEPRTFSLLKSLMDLEELQNFALLEGTALALKFSHRVSIDIDLFSSEMLDLGKLSEKFKNVFLDDFVNENPNVKFAILLHPIN